MVVSYMREDETSAGDLRSIYPSLAIRQILVTSQWASDVTINRPKKVTYLSITFNQGLWAYTYMRRSVNDTNKSDIDTCTIVIGFILVGLGS